MHLDPTPGERGNSKNHTGFLALHLQYVKKTEINTIILNNPNALDKLLFDIFACTLFGSCIHGYMVQLKISINFSSMSNPINHHLFFNIDNRVENSIFTDANSETIIMPISFLYPDGLGLFAN
jgi:hypothetical protein